MTAQYLNKITLQIYFKNIKKLNQGEFIILVK